MPEGALVNTGAVREPTTQEASARYGRCPLELHRLAGPSQVAARRVRHVESPLRGDTHGGFGGRARETGREQSRYRALVRPNGSAE